MKKWTVWMLVAGCLLLNAGCWSSTPPTSTSASPPEPTKNHRTTDPRSAL